MRRVAVAALLSLLVPAAALAQSGSASSSKGQPSSQGTSPSAQSSASAGDPMAGYTPPKVTREAQGKKELNALMQKMEAAAKKGDLEAAAALIDFPVMMITDSPKTGDAGGEAWTQEQWKKTMAPMYQPMPDMKTTHKPIIVFLSDSLASITDQWTMSMGGGKAGAKKMSGKSAMLAIRKGGEWKVKAMMEGGWGDMAAASGSASTSPSSGGSGSTETMGSSGAAGSATGTESGTSGTTGGLGSTGSTPRDTGTGSTGDTGTGSSTGTSGTTGGTGSTTGSDTTGTTPAPGSGTSTGSTGTTGSTETGSTSGTGTTGTTGSTPEPGGTK